MHKWQLYEAKNKLSNLIDIAMDGKAQCITKRGEDAVVVISMEEYRKLKKQKVNLRDFLLQAPKVQDVEIDRSIASSREVDL